jgi:hypothetical protein
VVGAWVREEVCVFVVVSRRVFLVLGTLSHTHMPRTSGRCTALPVENRTNQKTKMQTRGKVHFCQKSKMRERSVFCLCLPRRFSHLRLLHQRLGALQGLLRRGPEVPIRHGSRRPRSRPTRVPLLLGVLACIFKVPLVGLSETWLE